MFSVLASFKKSQVEEAVFSFLLIDTGFSRLDFALAPLTKKMVAEGFISRGISSSFLAWKAYVKSTLCPPIQSLARAAQKAE